MKEGRGDIMIVVGGVVPPQDYDALERAGAEAIFPPGTVIAEAAAELLNKLNAAARARPRSGGVIGRLHPAGFASLSVAPCSRTRDNSLVGACKCDIHDMRRPSAALADSGEREQYPFRPIRKKTSLPMAQRPRKTVPRCCFSRRSASSSQAAFNPSSRSSRSRTPHAALDRAALRRLRTRRTTYQRQEVLQIKLHRDDGAYDFVDEKGET